MRRLLAALAVVAWPAIAADPLPQPLHTSVNDFAAVLSPSDTRVIDEALIALHDATGIEGTVVTLSDRGRYGDASLETFATRLFNTWGVGDAGRNDGFMVLLAMAEREVRIELGAGYPAGADIRAGDIIGRVMVPRLRAGDASGALREGTLAAIETIALTRAEGRPVAPSDGGGGFGEGLLKAAVFGVFALSGAGILRGLLRRRRDAVCPACGRRGVARSERLVTGALPGGTASASREVTRRCPACGWSESRTLPVPVVVGGRRGGGRGWRGGRGTRGGGASGGFGGGRSGGGGASGRW